MNYPYRVLEKFVFFFCSCIMQLLSQHFHLNRLDRCTHSLPHSRLPASPLAATIISAEYISSITREREREQVHKLAAYPGDLLLYLSNTNTSVLTVMRIMSESGEKSGHRINFAKYWDLLQPLTTLRRITG